MVSSLRVSMKMNSDTGDSFSGYSIRKLSDNSSLDLAELKLRLRSAPDAALLKPLGIEALAIGSNALDQLPELAARFAVSSGRGAIALLMDAVPKRRGNTDLTSGVVQRLEGVREIRHAVLEGDGHRVHADRETIGRATDLVAGASCIVTIGSGTVADIGKAVSAAHGGMPHIVVQTATSVNGFADDQSVLLVDGVKRTTPTRYPDALIADTEILVGAPAPLNLAGVGDLLAMFTAPADWMVAAELGMADSYSPTAVAMVRAHGDAVLAAAPRLTAGDEAAATLIAKALTLSGVSMGIAGTTAPASGMEHTVSHLIEMAMNKRGLDAAFHGAQVGVSTIVSALLWDKVQSHLRTERHPRFLYPGAEAMDERVRAAFAGLDPSGAMADECWRLYSRKLERWSAHRELAGARDWSELPAKIAPLLSRPHDLVASMDSAGAPTRFGRLDPPVEPDLVRWALENCHLMRDRFTVADLAFFLGIWSKAHVEDLLADAAALGGGL
jgi:glycerol-1-phosphate dehydrogenase [NAD(P)+]